MNKNEYTYSDEEQMVVAEPAAAALSENVTRGGLLGQLTRLSRTDKVALIKYLKAETDADTNDSFGTDEFGRIVLTREMREAVTKAEQSLERGECLSEEGFKQRFAKWL